MTEDNPFDLRETAKRYGWKDTKDIKITIIAKGCRNMTDANLQLWWWMRNHFVKEEQLKIKENMDGKIIVRDGKTELELLHEDFQKTWYEVINFEEIKNE